MKLTYGKMAFLVIVALTSVSSAYDAMVFLKREEVSGMNKICYYDVIGSIHTLNVASYQVCPLTHNF